MEEQVIIDVQVDGANSVDEMARKASDLRNAIALLKNENKGLREEVAKGNKTEAEASKILAENEKVIKEYQATLKATNGVMQASVSENENFGDSLIEMRARLAQLKNEYASLSASERESAGGKEMLKKLSDLNQQVKDTEASFGDFQRNVGNYPKVVTAVIPGFDKLNGVLGSMGSSITDLASKGGAGFASLGKSAVSMGKLFLTPPIGVIVLILSAIMVAVKKVSEAFKKNDEASTRLSKAMATFQPIITAIGKAFDLLAVGISYAVEWLVKIGTQMLKLNPLFKAFSALFPDVVKGLSDEAKAQQELVEAQDRLEDTERQYTVNSAKRNKETAELRAKAREDEKYTAEQRMAFLQQALDNEKQNLEEEKNIAAERLRLLEAEAKKNNDTSDEMKNKIAQARAAQYQAEEAYYTGTRRLQSEFLSAQKEIQKQQEEQAKRYAEERKRQAENLLQLQREIEDKIVGAMKEGVDKQVEQARLAGEREIEQLKSREAKTKAEKEKIAQLIVLVEQNTQAQIDAIREKASDDELQKAREREDKRLQILLDSAVKGTREYTELRQTAITRQRDQELADTELTEQERLAIISKYNGLLQDVENERIQREYQQRQTAIANEYEQRRQKLEFQDVELAQLELEQARQQQFELLNLDEATKLAMFETQEAYEQAVIASNQRVIESTRNVQKTALDTTATQLASVSGMLGSISSLFGELAGDNEKMAGFQLSLALGQIAIDTAKGIAGAVSAGAGVPFPANLVAIASGIATVTAGIVSASQAIKKYKQAKAPKFAGGGIVPGSSYSGDRVVANVNSGEMILNAQQQAKLFDIANNKVSSGGFDYDAFATATAEAVAQQPAPVMVYSEFESFTQKKTNYDELARL